jgi:hypothetical protein
MPTASTPGIATGYCRPEHYKTFLEEPEMTKPLDARAIAGAIFQSVLASPKRVRRLRSSTFWGEFHVGRRTGNLIQSVQEALVANNLIVSMPPDTVFGKESPKSWITIAYVEPRDP